MDPLELEVVVNGQERQAEDLKQELQIAAARAEDEGAVLSGRPLERQAEVTRPDDGIRRPLIGPGRLEPELHDTRQGVAPGGREGPGIELHFFHEVHVDHADRSSACPLGLEVVDVGNLDAVDVEAILVGGPSPDDDVVAETRDGRHTGQAPNGLADVPAASGIALDLVGADPAQGDRSLLLPLGGHRHHFGRLHRHRQGLEGHRQKGGTGWRELDFEPVGRLVAHRTEAQIDHTGRETGEFKRPLEIGGGAGGRPLDDDAHEREEFSRHLIGDDPLHRGGLSHGGNRKEEE